MKLVCFPPSDSSILSHYNVASRSKLNIRLMVICAVSLLFLLSIAELIWIIILYLRHQEVLCLTRYYEQGICTVPNLCPSKSKESGHIINTCGLINYTQAICCPIWSSFSLSGLIELSTIASTNIVSSTPPVASTKSNIVSSIPPVASTQRNIVSSSVALTQSSIVGSSSPVASTKRNIVSSSSPVSSTQLNIVSSSSPVASTQGSIVSSSSPVASTQGKIVGSSSPVASTQGSIVGSSSPVASTQGKFVGSSSPVASTQRNIVGLISFNKPLQTNLINASFVVQPTPSKSNIVSPAERIAKQKCQEYAKTVILEIPSPILGGDTSGIVKVDTCSRIATPLIANGEEASPKEFPHMVLIGYGESVVSWQCGGSLISKRFVLSAAHCASSSMGLATWAKVGDFDTSTDLDEALPETFRIVDRIVHPKYKRAFVYNDIALFKLERDVEISAFVRPLCLFTSKEIPQNEATATGWGQLIGGINLNISRNPTENETEQNVSSRPKPYWSNSMDLRTSNYSSIQSESGPASSKLMKTKLNLVSSKTCKSKYKSSSIIPWGIRAESQICAGDGNNDTCKGDSGGPLQIALNDPYCMYGVIGITSFGKLCSAGYPGVYTRVYYFLPWIVKTVWPELL